MIFSLLILILSGCVLLLPLVFWMYIFTTFFPNSISKLQFLGGVIIGGFSSIPFVFHGGSFIWDILENIFSELLATSFLWVVQNVSLIFMALLLLYFSVWFFFQDFRRRYSNIFLYSSAALLCMVIIGSLLSFGLQAFLPALSQISVWYAGVISFVSVGGIFAYYSIIAIIEEGNKYISSLSFSGKQDYFCVIEKYLSLSACIALGFAFFENILYTYFYLQDSWVWPWLLSLVFFRSIFTIILHLMSSILFALGFWYVIWGEYSWTWTKILKAWIFIFLGIISHILFDSALSFWYVGLLILYIFLMYILMS